MMGGHWISVSFPKRKCWSMWDLRCTMRSFVAVHKLSSCGTRTLELWCLDSRVCRLSSCGLSHSVACGILVPQPGIEPMSPALQGGFLTTGPPGRSLLCFIEKLCHEVGFISKNYEIYLCLPSHKVWFTVVYFIIPPPQI